MYPPKEQNTASHRQLPHDHLSLFRRHHPVPLSLQRRLAPVPLHQPRLSILPQLEALVDPTSSFHHSHCSSMAVQKPDQSARSNLPVVEASRRPLVVLPDLRQTEAAVVASLRIHTDLATAAVAEAADSSN